MEKQEVIGLAEYVTGEALTGEDIKELRRVLGFTQKELAAFLRCSKRTVENWEKASGRITGPVVPPAEILMRQPDLAEKLRLPEKHTRLRVWYYYRHMVCTIMDVDEMNRKVTIRNYIDNPLFRAFGRNTEPSYEEYEEFLESRCFPRTRDKMKLQLKELDLPFYDPVMIIEKTEGRMAEDDFWVRIEI